LYALNTQPLWGVAWGVAGNAHIADKFSDKVKSLIQSQTKYNLPKLELLVENCLKHIRKQYPNPDDDIDVVFGIFGRPLLSDDGSNIEYYSLPEWTLYRGTSETACLSPEREYAVAGMDVTLASFVLDNMYFKMYRVDQTQRLGVFTTALMEKYAAGVGGPIEGLSYRPDWGAFRPLLNGEVETILKQFPIDGMSGICVNASKWWSDNPAHLDFKKVALNELAVNKAKKPIPQSSNLSGHRQKAQKKKK
jgi:hypothetical protein